MLGLVEVVNKHRLFKRLVDSAKQCPSGAAHPQPEERYIVRYIQQQTLLEPRYLCHFCEFPPVIPVFLPLISPVLSDFLLIRN
jgi:hypothetical protein